MLGWIMKMEMPPDFGGGDVEETEGKPRYCGCGARLSKKSYETIRQFEKRQFCDAKCRGTHGPRSRPKRTFGIESTDQRGRIGAGFLSSYLNDSRAACRSDPRRWNLEQPKFTGSNFKDSPETDAKYLAFIRTQPCLVPGCKEKSEAHHQPEPGKSTMGGKTSDTRTLPICWHHHTGGGTKELPGSYHGQARFTGRAFYALYRIDPEHQITLHNLRFQIALKERKAPKEGRL